MRSRLLSFFDYTKSDFYPEPIEVTEDDLAHEAGNDLEALRIQSAINEDVQTVQKGDACRLSLSGTSARFQKSDIAITVGLGLFNRDIESALQGRTVGASFTVETKGEAVAVTILSASRRVIPDALTDEMVLPLQMEGIDTLEAYKAYLRQWYLDFYRYEYTYHVFGAECLRQCFEKSEWSIDSDEEELLYRLWKQKEEEDMAFHDTYIAENYPGEAEEMYRDDSGVFFE